MELGSVHAVSRAAQKKKRPNLTLVGAYLIYQRGESARATGRVASPHRLIREAFEQKCSSCTEWCARPLSFILRILSCYESHRFIELELCYESRSKCSGLINAVYYDVLFRFMLARLNCRGPSQTAPLQDVPQFVPTLKKIQQRAGSDERLRHLLIFLHIVATSGSTSSGRR